QRARRDVLEVPDRRRDEVERPQWWPSMGPAETRRMDPVKGAVAGAIGGAAGAYTMELFQAWWNDAEKRLAPKRRAHAAKDTAARAKDEPATVKVAGRVSKKVLDRPVPDELKPAAGEAVHYTTGATIRAIYGFVP